MMKYILRDELKEKLGEIFGLLREMKSKEKGLEYLEVLLRYISEGTDKVGERDIKNAVKAALLKGGEGVMPTLAEKWFHEGELKGEFKGELKHARKSVVEVLEVKFGIVSAEFLDEINRIDNLQLLDDLLKKVIKTDSMEEFKGVLRKGLN